MKHPSISISIIKTIADLTILFIAVSFAKWCVFFVQGFYGLVHEHCLNNNVEILVDKLVYKYANRRIKDILWQIEQ